jgi:N-acetylmuramoyl-L-alanine amidase
LIFVAGCATRPSVPPPETISEAVPTAPSPLNWSNPSEMNLTEPEATRPQERTVPPAKPATPMAPKPAPIVTTWISLPRWAAEHKTGAPHRISDLPVATYAIGSKYGVIVLVIGSHGATWNGVEINLGFTPEIIDGEVCMNELDLQKNLEPLLCEPPITFGTNCVIVIDPGHGGSNTGTHSILDGRFEKEFTLDWAKRLAPLLETNGWKVFLTRTNDVDMSLSNRVAFAEEHHADLFVSLHFNAAVSDPKQTGLETYCITPTGMPSTLTRGYADPWSEVVPNNYYDAQNLQFAVLMQDGLLRVNGLEDRGVRRARFIGVLRGQKRPAILIEAGYLSNPREAKLIESPEYRQKLAEAFANALK